MLLLISPTNIGHVNRKSNNHLADFSLFYQNVTFLWYYLPLGYMLPVIRAHQGLSPVRTCPCWAYCEKNLHGAVAAMQIFVFLMKIFLFL